MNTKLSERLLVCIRELATNRAVTDTVWLGDSPSTVVEELAMIAEELGATDDELDDVFKPGGGSDERANRSNE